MCGISGLFDTRGKREFDRAVFARINDIQAHRGPDEADLHLEPGVAFGHRRLSVIDLATLTGAIIVALGHERAGGDEGRAGREPARHEVLGGAPRLLVEAAAKTLELTKSEKANAEKAIAAAQKDIPQRDKNLEEIAKSYAELTPQVEPMKAKVKASQEQYFAMLPKREVGKKN